jgi:serine/threonine protein kinase
VSAPHLGPGHVVAGKYTIRSLLAFGGATATYHATDAQGGQVALKLLDPALGQRADVMSELERVRAATSALAGASVLPTLDAGYDASTSAPFQTSELLTIPALSRLLDNGPLSAEVVSMILRGLALAIDSAHASGLCHLALKPTNLFVGPAPHYPVLVTDFSARVIRDAIPTHEAYALSAPWSAPEQLQSGVQQTSAADVYAAALIAFYALVGRSYWRTCQSSPVDVQALQQEMYAPHVPVSARAQEYGRPLHPAYDAGFARALAFQPAERLASVGQLVQTLWPGLPTQAAAGYGASPRAGYPAASYPEAVPSSPYAAAPPPQPSSPVASYQPTPAGAVSTPAPVPAAGPHPGTPGLPAFPEPVQKAKPRGMLPVIIGIVGAVLLGGGAVAYLFLRTPVGKGEPVASAAPTSRASSVEVDTTTASSGSAETPASTAPDGGEPDASADAGGGETVEVTFVCVPDCDEVVLDGERQKDPSQPVQLLPGKHTVQVAKAGYVPRKDTFEVELGKPIEKKYPLVRVTTTPKRPCGKFLKRCD